ncbi:GNAT family N-acetyltransferase [Dyadobacter sp. CY351]|uniref:GNAT family N-acetyltransferase n=1 Tax=Dyadobacter sp. CY351 TaxID=2909337 RepID=UPI001F207ECE|nr:GNAT family N-acetyltransferase [Dyadobacter sp. CY351]MCF2518246.1 GNAT family N-acetyltransferase [Dyadobacter sp. CY351]
MTPLLIERAQICDATWNEHIRESLQCVIYAQTYYLDTVCESWKALVWPNIQHPDIVMPIPIRRKWGFQVVYQPIFCQYLGLFSLKPLSGLQLESFLRVVSKEFSYIAAYQFSPENSIRLSALAHTFPDFNFSQKHTHWLHLKGDVQQLDAGYSKDRKRNLVRSKGYNWEVQRSADIQPLIKLFKENQTARIPGGIDPDAFNRLEALFNVLQARQQAELYYGLSSEDIHAGHLHAGYPHAGHPHAGILIVKFGGRAIYLFNAADQKGRKDNARTFMLDHYFRSIQDETLIFDFESPEVGSIAQFYLSFGSFPVSFYAIRRNELWFPLKQFQEWRKRFFKTRRGLF